MNFNNLVSGEIGLTHLLASIIALMSGTAVLLLKKGTGVHKRVGYIYALSMLVLLLTAFAIYRLFGRWGVFHWTAVLSSATLLCGLIPVLIRKPANTYLSLHFGFMYWSVIGLYGAFMAETFVRLPRIVIESGIPNRVFYQMTGVAVGITMAVGAYFFIRNKSKWEKLSDEKTLSASAKHSLIESFPRPMEKQ